MSSDLIITYNSLYNLLREERKSKTLTKLPNGFYKAVKKYLEEKKEELKTLKNNKEREKLKKELKIFENSKKLIENLLEIRFIKISEIAIKNTLKNELIIDEDPIEEKIEKTLLKEMKKIIRELKNEVE